MPVSVTTNGHRPELSEPFRSGPLYGQVMSTGANAGAEGEEMVVDEDGFLLPHLRYDYAGQCWWCGEQADSKEHKHKKSEVKRQFGQGPYTGVNAVVRGVGGQQRLHPVQGPDSAQLKFPEVLCGRCNSSRSQKADLAYDTFSAYIAEEAEHLLRTACFRWSDIFPENWRNGRDLVTAYWLKHIGCRLAEGGIQVAPELGAFLDTPGDLRPVPVRMSLEIRDDIADMQRADPTLKGSLWLGGLQCSYSRSRQRVTSASSFCGQGWLRLYYHYDTALQSGAAAFWRKKVRLPRGRSIGKEMFEER